MANEKEIEVDANDQPDVGTVTLEGSLKMGPQFWGSLNWIFLDIPMNVMPKMIISKLQ